MFFIFLFLYAAETPSGAFAAAESAPRKLFSPVAKSFRAAEKRIDSRYTDIIIAFIRLNVNNRTGIKQKEP